MAQFSNRLQTFLLMGLNQIYSTKFPQTQSKQQALGQQCNFIKACLEVPSSGVYLNKKDKTDEGKTKFNRFKILPITPRKICSLLSLCQLKTFSKSSG
ncbi:hypothetical protein CMK22_10280 [Candidatus Poribacteria bacterium]|nr:hypothetical protein [Candidatus Poribacteria bacterium]